MVFRTDGVSHISESMRILKAGELFFAE